LIKNNSFLFKIGDQQWQPVHILQLSHVHSVINNQVKEHNVIIAKRLVVTVHSVAMVALEIATVIFAVGTPKRDICDIHS